MKVLSQPATTQFRQLNRPFQHVGGHCWAADVPDLASRADDLQHPRRSPVLLLEDDRLLQRPHSMHADIREKGEGRYSHWGTVVYFATSDGSNPNENGRSYAISMLPETDDQLFRENVSEAERGVCRNILETAEACGQMGIVDTLEHLFGLFGRRVLEIGCGHCWYAPTFLRRGASCFVGTDPYKDFDINLIYDYRGHRSGTWMNAYQKVDRSLRDFLGCYRNIDLSHDPIEDLETPGAGFDAAFMISVTEHLRSPRESFRRISELLSPGGYLYITHHNYYGWNGHHRALKFSAEIDLSDVGQQRVVDWNHIRQGLLNFDEDAG
ncbi:MAG: class I SAM-dependent methyltransferase, partial [Planctomycetota bacterium]